MFLEVYGARSRAYVFGSLFVTLLLVCVLSCSVATILTPSDLFVFALYSCIFFLSFFYSFFFFYRKNNSSEAAESSPSFQTDIVLHLVVSLVGAIFLEGATVFGSPASHFFNLSDWSKKRIIFFFALIYALWFAVDYLSFRRAEIKQRCFRGERTLSKVMAFAVLPLIVLIVSKFVSFGVGDSFIKPLIPILIAVLCLLMRHPYHFKIGIEWPFLYIALIFSVFLALFMPVTSGISWDDQIHYQNALDTSYVFGVQETDTDLNFVNQAYFRATAANDVASLTEWSSEDNAKLSSSFDATYKDDISNNRIHKKSSRIFSLSSLGYIPSAVGLWVARLFHISFSGAVVLGRLFNAVSYSLVFFFAIRVTPVKKSLFACCGLIPTSLFLASNYSYDAWLISMTALGLAYFLKAAWGNREDFNQVNLILAFVFMFLGLAVKAVYFPLIGLFYCVPIERFTSLSQRRRYYFAVTIFGLLMVASFALPYLFTVKGDRGDTRGSLDVSPFEQILFILDSPLRYVGILSNFFLTVFLNPLNASSYFVNYAYLGNLQSVANVANPSIIFGLVPFVALFLLGLISGNESSSRQVHLSFSLWGIFLFVCSIVLVATALYVSFTPVGKNTVDGCQFRYLLPLLIPFFTCVTNVRFAQFGDTAVLKMAQMLFSVVALLTCTVFLCFSCF